MATGQTENDWRAMLASAGPYPIEAFGFVRDGLGHTVEQVHKANEALDTDAAAAASHQPASHDGANASAGGSADAEPNTPSESAEMGTSGSMISRMPSDSRHVSGQQLCLGLRDYAIKRYGMMAPAVLQSWNLRRTEDFGRIVFAMIEHGLMSKTAEDTLDDFRSVYEFEEAFAREALIRHVGRS